MQTDKGTMKTETIFSDDRSRRYLLRREWDNKKLKATVIMTNPSTADLHTMDFTTLYSLKSAATADKIIIAWGKGGENSQKLGQMQRALLEQLRPHEKKLHLIADSTGRAGFHPLAPQIRFTWQLKHYQIPKVETAQKNQSTAGAVVPAAVGA